MKSERVPGGVIVISFAVFVAACGSGGSNDTGAGGTTGTAGSAAGGTTGTAGSAAGGTTGTAGSAAGGTTGTAGAAGGTTGAGGTSGAGGSGGPIRCNDLNVTGDFIPQTVGSGTKPVASGGSIADGTYVLTKIEVYPPASPTILQIKATMMVAGTDLQWITAFSTSSGVNHHSYTTMTVGTNWVLMGTCPSAGITPIDPPKYTASASTLLVFTNGQIQTFTKQ